MRTREYLSPSAIKLFFEDIEQFYKRYLSDITTPRYPQNPAMAIGSGFDAFVKSYLHSAIFGENYDDRFKLENLFETQVEEHIRGEIWDEAKYCFECYKNSGALADLLTELNQASKTPQFEVELTTIINDPSLSVSCQFDDLTLLGKPDLIYHNREGHLVVHDWKVNGYFSKSPKSPEQGYMRLRSMAGPGFDDKQHKHCVPKMYKGTLINADMEFEDVNPDWAAQVAIYGWILGQPIGSDFIASIDQIVCARQDYSKPVIRVAEHRALIGRDFQIMTFAKAQFVWDCIKSGHIFKDMTKDESERRCKVLDEVNRLVVEEPEKLEGIRI